MAFVFVLNEESIGLGWIEFAGSPGIKGGDIVEGRKFMHARWCCSS